MKMHEQSKLVSLLKRGSIVLSLGVASLAWAAEPDCEGGFSLCGYCGITISEVAGTEEIVTVGPDLGLIWDTVWAACPTAGVCCGSNSCTLSWSTTSVTSGMWSVEAGATFGIPLPQDYTLGLNGVLEYQGSAQRTVQAGVVNDCTIGNCRKSTQELGPGYTAKIRTVDAEKVCRRPTYGDGGLITCVIADDCSPIVFERTSFLKYLSHESYVRGVCGLPVSPSGCPECEDPQNPDCSS